MTGLTGLAPLTGLPAFVARPADLVVDVLHARALVDHVLDLVLGVAIVHRPFQRDLAFAHFNGHFARIEVLRVVQALGDVFLDALVGALPALRTAARARAPRL